MNLQPRLKLNRAHNPGRIAATAGALVALLLATSLAWAKPPCDQIADGRDERPVPPQCLAQQEQLNALRQATNAFFSFEVGQSAGWDTPLSECVESPFGGMGYHYANLDRLADGAQLSLLHPEVLLYEPTEDGSMAFVGVEYIIPAAAWSDAAPPEFMGRTLHYNPVQDIWALHVWVGRDNPDGIFEDWNPDVSCEFAPDPE